MISKAKENDQDLCAYEDDKTSSTFNQFEGTFNFTSSDTERYGTSVLPFKIIASSGQSSDEVTILLNLAILIEEGIKVSTESEGRAQEVGDASEEYTVTIQNEESDAHQTNSQKNIYVPI